MARNHRICKACGKPIARNHHWRLVEASIREQFFARMWGRPPAPRRPQHWDCKRPNQHEPTAIWGKVHRLPQDEPFTNEEMGVLR